MYARDIVMNVTNPKVAVFFLAFLPQFADPQRWMNGVAGCLFLALAARLALAER